MACNHARQVQLYYDGEMTPRDRQAFELHSSACPECLQSLAELKGLSALIGAAPMADLPTGVAIRLKNASPVARERGVLRMAGWLSATAAAILLTAVLGWPDRVGVSGSSSWESAALSPPIDTAEELDSAPDQVADWMAESFSSGRSGELR